MKHPEACCYERLGNGRVRCLLCPHHCSLAEGRAGICLTRHNDGGVLRTANYCRPVSTAIDPIEKKPLYHFHPGTDIFSMGPNGCTFKCVFCQNADISQRLLPATRREPAELCRAVVDSATLGAAYTYSEPFIWFETIMATGAMLRERGLRNVMVTNGFMEPGPLDELLRVVDAMNIDVKSMNPAFYRRLCKARLAPVLRSCEQVKRAGCHLEITNLLIPGHNDSDEEIDALVAFVAGHLGSDTPLHFSRYVARHRCQAPATPVDTLMRARERARARLDYVYAGNIAPGEHSHTRCPGCDALIIERAGYRARIVTAATRAEAAQLRCAACNRLLSGFAGMGGGPEARLT